MSYTTRKHMSMQEKNKNNRKVQAGVMQTKRIEVAGKQQQHIEDKELNSTTDEEGLTRKTKFSNTRKKKR